MSQIRDIRIIPLEFRLGAGEGYGSARGITNSRGGGLVILETEDGVHGIGEAWGPAAVSRAYLEMVKPLYVGRSVFAQRGAAQTVLAQMYHFGTQNQLTALLGGIDIAAHDAMGKLLDLSVADLIGGRQRERVPVYASGGYFTETGDQILRWRGSSSRLPRAGSPRSRSRLGGIRRMTRRACSLRDGSSARRRCLLSTPTATTRKTVCWKACAALRPLISIGTKSRWHRRIGPDMPA